MKNTIQLNIGIATLDGGTLTIPEIATALRRHGLVLTASRIVTGQWEGKEETTLACEAIPALPVCHHECRLAILSAVGELSRELRQTCIALAWPEGGGELCPPVSGQSFDPIFFHPADRVTFAEVPAKLDRDGAEKLVLALEYAEDMASEAASSLACTRQVIAEVHSKLLLHALPACDCLANVIDACLHNSLVSRDNGDRTGCDKYWRLGQDLQSNSDNLRAVLCPTIPARNPEITSGW